MRFKVILAVSLATSFLAGAATEPAWSQSKEDVDRINKWFDKNAERQKNMDEYWKKKPGELQKVRDDWQKAGDIQKAGPIEIPKGWDAIAKVKVPCQQRFRVSSDTLFEFNKATLTPYAVQTLGLLLPEFQKYKNHPIKVEGHTDAIGTDEYNQGLSERRAERVYNWFLENEIFSKEALSTVGFGEKHPIAPNTNPNGSDNPKGRALNRRVEIVVNTCVTLDGSEPPEKDPAAAATAPAPAVDGTTTQAADPATTPATGGTTAGSDASSKASPEVSKDATEGGSTDSSAKEDAKGDDAASSTPGPDDKSSDPSSDKSSEPTSEKSPESTSEKSPESTSDNSSKTAP